MPMPDLIGIFRTAGVHRERGTCAADQAKTWSAAVNGVWFLFCTDQSFCTCYQTSWSVGIFLSVFVRFCRWSLSASCCRAGHLLPCCFCCCFSASSASWRRTRQYKRGSTLSTDRRIFLLPVQATPSVAIVHFCCRSFCTWVFVHVGTDLLQSPETWSSVVVGVLVHIYVTYMVASSTAKTNILP